MSDLLSEKFPVAVKFVRLSDNTTRTLARFCTREEAAAWLEKWGPEYRKPKWGFGEIWID